MFGFICTIPENDLKHEGLTLKPLLEVVGLTVAHDGGNGDRQILHEVSFDIQEGEVFALIGESGSGKTTLANSLTRLSPYGSGLSMEGSVRIDGREISEFTTEELRLLRRHGIRYIFQEPLQSLNPLARIQSQFALAMESLKDGPGRSGNSSAQWLARLGIENPSDVLDSYPHQLSGGMAQRVMLAMALAPSPKLLIADEPTSALDAPLRYQILDLLMALRESEGMAVLLITHDLSIARRYAHRIAVLYAGRILELAPREEFFKTPLHPYSQLLLQAASFSVRSVEMAIDENPSKSRSSSGCRFLHRCYKAEDDCGLNEPQLEQVDGGRTVRCPYWKL